MFIRPPNVFPPSLLPDHGSFPVPISSDEMQVALKEYSKLSGKRAVREVILLDSKLKLDQSPLSHMSQEDVFAAHL